MWTVKPWASYLINNIVHSNNLIWKCGSLSSSQYWVDRSLHHISCVSGFVWYVNTGVLGSNWIYLISYCPTKFLEFIKLIFYLCHIPMAFLPSSFWSLTGREGVILIVWMTPCLLGWDGAERTILEGNHLWGLFVYLCKHRSPKCSQSEKWKLATHCSEQKTGVLSVRDTSLL